MGSASAGEPKKSPLPLPTELTLVEFEKQLYQFLDDRAYDQDPGHLGWVRDKCVRDTGEYLDKTYYGTHPAVRVYYSPEVIAWLKNNRQGNLPDGTTIIKEQYTPPAARYDRCSEAELREKLTSWTVMIKDCAGSKDGWFWADYTAHRPSDKESHRQTPDSHEFPFIYPSAGFGQYCIRCHATAERESTFITTKNIEGFPGDPLTFRVDDSWTDVGEAEQAAIEMQHGHGLSRRARHTELRLSRPAIDSNFEFLRAFQQFPRVHYNDVKGIPNVSYDRVPPRLNETKGRFLTSDQCMSCHGGLSGPFQQMFLPVKSKESDAEIRGINFSPHGEWRWSMMGLAGRDPVFYAQLETELARHGHSAERKQSIVDTCFRCHGVMGQRQHHADHPGQPFQLEFTRITDPADRNFEYGALAREGVSCTVCHRVVDDRKPIEELIMGNFATSDEPVIFGPYEDKDISPLAMKNGLGLEPKHNPYIKSARMCASCHVLRVPIYDQKGRELGKQFEQATYLEWLNSQYENEFNKENPQARSCQQCHMPGDYHEPGQPDHIRKKLPATVIATVEDESYPLAENRMPIEQIRTHAMKDYSRHELLGINTFVLEMFNQFDNVLGVRKTDFMTGAVDGLPNAIEHALHQARSATATVDVISSEIRGKTLVSKVKVTNLTGHRFPSGVGFRRAFLAFEVIDTSEGRERTAWGSGRTNNLGMIVDDNGCPLPSESFEPDRHGNRHQPHYTAITSQDQVQIYQELSQNPEGHFTTSFLELHRTVKDNRLLPRGWSASGPKGCNLPDEFLKATHPEYIDEDPDFLDGTGSDIITYEVPMGRWKPDQLKVQASLYYQSIPPFYLAMRFGSAQGEATQRLHYLCSHLNLEGDMKCWKLLIDTDEKPVGAEKR